jgi:hypothetical protein
MKSNRPLKYCSRAVLVYCGEAACGRNNQAKRISNETYHASALIPARQATGESVKSAENIKWWRMARKGAVTSGVIALYARR